MRVIAGTAKGRRLRSVPGKGTRPITDRAKEALFNIIATDVVESNWWDMFAGTGAVGIEALSRGAAYVRFTDMHRGPIETIHVNLAQIGLMSRAEVIRADAFGWLGKPPDRQFDYLYIAPPQYQGLWSLALRSLDNNLGWLSPDGWVIVQIDPKEYQRMPSNALVELESRKYGTTLLVFYSRS